MLHKFKLDTRRSSLSLRRFRSDADEAPVDEAATATAKAKASICDSQSRADFHRRLPNAKGWDDEVIIIM